MDEVPEARVRDWLPRTAGDQRAQMVLAEVRSRTNKIEPIEYDDPGAADDGLSSREVYGVISSGPEGGLILLLVVLGNPGSGGIYAPEFLPTWLRGMHRWNVPGLATDLIKSAVHFDRRSIGWSVTGLALWAVLGLAALLAATLVRGRRAQPRRDG